MNIKTISSAGYNFWADGTSDGDTVYVSVPICSPDVLSEELGGKTIHAYEVKPSIRSVRGFPGPINL